MKSENSSFTGTSQPDDSSSPDEQPLRISVKSHSKAAIRLSLEPGAEAEVTIQKLNAEGGETGCIRRRFLNRNSLQQPILSASSNKASIPWQSCLLILALVVYLVSRFIGLDSYPIYFFTDEAVQTVLAADLVENDFRGSQNELLPTYFENGGQYNLGVSVYAQIIPFLLFGKSIWVTRGTSVVISLLAALAVGLILKNIFKSCYAFLSILLLGVTPAWFLHSRTAFETVIAVSFYAAFLYSYLMYLKDSPKYFLAAVVFGMLCFYSYSPAQMVMIVTSLGLFVSDWRVHLKNRKIFLIGLGVGLILAVPYFRFLLLHPGENTRHMEILNSYWIQSIPLSEKLGLYFKEYIKQLNPLYWFGTDTIDLERHVMKNYGNLLRWSLPFFALGMVVALRKIKQPEYRVFLISLLAAPSGAALVQAGITRALFMVIPAGIITAIGMEQTLVWFEKVRVPSVWLGVFTFLGLIAFTGFMLRDALVNGPVWYENYSLNGQQYGAKQVFAEIHELLEENSQQTIYMTPSWTNGTDVLARFFFDDPLPFAMGSIDYFLNEKRLIPDNQVFILSPEEMDRANKSGKLKVTEEIKIIPYPDGTPGFYVVKLQYTADIDEILTAEKTARRQLIDTELIDSKGDKLHVRYPTLDMGEIQSLFDGDLETLARTSEANPMRLEISLDEPKTIRQVTVRIGGTATTVDVEITSADGAVSAYQSMVEENNDFRNVTIQLEHPVTAERIAISIMNTLESEPAHVHAWEVSFQ